MIRTTGISLLFFFSFLSFILISSAAGENWKIGVLVCLTGECAADGTDAVRGAKLAATEINGAGSILGRNVELVIQDTNEAVSGATAVAAFLGMRLDPSLSYFIGPSWTPAGLALAPIAAADKSIILSSPSLGAPEFHRAGDNIFNVHGTDEASSRSEARYAISRGVRRAAILSSQQAWEAQQADFFEDEFTKLGGTITAREEPLPTVTDIHGDVLKILRSKPEAVYLASMILMGKGARALRQLQFQGLLIGSKIDKTRIADGQGALEGAVFFSFHNPEGSFLEKYRREYGTDKAQLSAAVAYDTVYAYRKAAEHVRSFDVEKVKRAMSVLDFEGASGRIRFDLEGCAIREVQGWVVAGEGYRALPDENY